MKQITKYIKTKTRPLYIKLLKRQLTKENKWWHVICFKDNEDHIKQYILY